MVYVANLHTYGVKQRASEHANTTESSATSAITTRFEQTASEEAPDSSGISSLSSALGASQTTSTEWTEIESSPSSSGRCNGAFQVLDAGVDERAANAREFHDLSQYLSRISAASYDRRDNYAPSPGVSIEPSPGEPGPSTRTNSTGISSSPYSEEDILSLDPEPSINLDRAGLDLGSQPRGFVSSCKDCRFLRSRGRHFALE